MDNDVNVYIGLGSNLGYRQMALQQAVDGLRDVLTGLTCSPVYETPPWGLEAQPKFLNAVVGGWTGLSVWALLDVCQSLEVRIGRQPTRKWGERLIDLDILLYGRQRINDNRVQVPHPHLKERAFVLQPLLDLDVTVTDPETERPLAEYLKLLQEQRQGIRVFGKVRC